ncbi:MAG TPA: hypothetical protein VEK38_01905 [Candidatus Bathyarchaeia archaeon]|nr:hypothetical protein [Candidatus Bathyarchaeia archaeon]
MYIPDVLAQVKNNRCQYRQAFENDGNIVALLEMVREQPVPLYPLYVIEAAVKELSKALPIPYRVFGIHSKIMNMRKLVKNFSHHSDDVGK